ncbi:MAG: NADH-quinone oxidoreductase subunit A, partial [Planctomycetota bacterium]
VASDFAGTLRLLERCRNLARQLQSFTMIDIAMFFGVLLVGFAYVWFRGDLDWVRAVSSERSKPPATAGPAASGMRAA